MLLILLKKDKWCRFRWKILKWVNLLKNYKIRLNRAWEGDFEIEKSCYTKHDFNVRRVVFLLSYSKWYILEHLYLFWNCATKHDFKFFFFFFFRRFFFFFFIFFFYIFFYFFFFLFSRRACFFFFNDSCALRNVLYKVVSIISFFVNSLWYNWLQCNWFNCVKWNYQTWHAKDFI